MVVDRIAGRAGWFVQLFLHWTPLGIALRHIPPRSSAWRRDAIGWVIGKLDELWGLFIRGQQIINGIAAGLFRPIGDAFRAR